MGRNPAHLHAGRAGEASETGGRDQILIRKAFQNPIDQKSLGLRLVQGFAHNVGLAEQFWQIIFREPHNLAAIITIGVNRLEVAQEGYSLILAHIL